MFGSTHKVKAFAGSRDELAAILAGMGSMPGCLSYLVAHDPTDPDGVWVTEVWESAEAHRASLELPEVREAVEIDRCWGAFLAGGGRPSRCGRLEDRYGPSWQVVSPGLAELLGDPNPERSSRAFETTSPMSKIDLAAIEAAVEPQ